MRPHEMHRYLLDHTDFETADEIVYHVYHSEILNRLFFEDYEAYFAQSKFEKIEISKFMPDVKPDPETQQRLEHLHPGRKDFSTTGILVVAEKEPEPALSLLRSDVPGARGNAARCGVSPYRSAPTRKERIDFVKQANNRLPDDTRRYYPLTPSDDEPLKRRIGIVVRLPGTVDQRPQAHVQRSPIDG